jgi:hypothetical protein
MNLVQVQEWVMKMEKLYEADMPMEIGGYIMTPYELLKHAENDDDIWKIIREKELD